MKTPSWKPLALAVLAALSIASLPAAAQATTTQSLEPIPTMLVADDDPTDYPDPICSKCTIIVIEDEDSASTRAGVLVGYPADAPRFIGEIAVTVLLASGERRSLWLSDVSLEPGAEVELVAEAEADWSWEEVRFVWLRFLAQ
jgi:ABC-type amino acid transport substrate-binding protein